MKHLVTSKEIRQMTRRNIFRTYSISNKYMSIYILRLRDLLLALEYHSTSYYQLLTRKQNLSTLITFFNDTSIYICSFLDI